MSNKLETSMKANDVATYIAAGCNRSPHCMSVENDQVFYGACNAVVVSRLFPDHIQCSQTLVGHKDRVNCVRFLSTNRDDGNTFISTSTDKTVCVWSELKLAAILEGHEASVTCADGFSDYIASTSADSTVRIWKRRGETLSDWICEQIIPVARSGFSLDLRVFNVNGRPWIFMSLDDCTIQVWSMTKNDDGNGDRFQLVHKLTGMDDWCQTLDVVQDVTGDILLASGCQDSLIRVWRFASVDEAKAKEERRMVKDLSPGEEIKAKEAIFRIDDSFYSVALDTILSGHEDKVYGLNWSRSQASGMSLLSCSLDKTMILWRKGDDDDVVWVEAARVGEVGGNTLGFLGCQMAGEGRMLGYSFNGAFHFWSCDKELNTWQPQVTVGGHFGPVEDLAWESPGGRYLVTTSADQTTRIHAPWRRESGEQFHEVARPQVHGYDLCCLTTLPGHRMASGAEEKLVRAFEATDNFIQNIGSITAEIFDQAGHKFSTGASVPSLGLSNKAVNSEAIATSANILDDEKHVKDHFPDHYFTPDSYNRPPPEETLVQNTLWPEVQKLYGHGYEIFTVASNHKGDILASACKATTSEHAAIYLWDTKSWKNFDKLVGHSLTVVQMSFSPCDRYLLSVSRDRTWCLWTLDDTGQWSLKCKTDKKTSGHQRIIWSCDWSQDSKYFATAGRDKRIVLWSTETRTSASKNPLVLEDSVTAIAFAPLPSRTVLVAGLDNGKILFVEHDRDGDQEWRVLKHLDNSVAHHKTVRRLKFKPNSLTLASCSADHHVKLYNCDFLNSS